MTRARQVKAKPKRKADKKRTLRQVDDSILQLRLTIQESCPRIWREVLVPAEFPLSDLHLVIQAAMGWSNREVHQFEMEDKGYAPPEQAAGSGLEDEQEVTVGALLPRPKMSIYYAYDYIRGDYFEVDVRLVQRQAKQEGEIYPRCIAGAHAGPLEGGEGIWTYNEMAEAWRMKEEIDEETRRWLGPAFDPDRFDLEETDRQVRAYRELAESQGPGTTRGDEEEFEPWGEDDEDWLFPYDANEGPDPERWLELDESERIEAVMGYHEVMQRELGQRGADPALHAMMHAVVETQLADGSLKAVPAALERLEGQGLSRHDAVHAIGGIVAKHLWRMMKEQVEFDEERYNSELGRLTRESWEALADEDTE
ncbi:MAG: DUF1841 family protein [Bradymonadales bacterium]|nr:DUF1841 family protein [Bradymonadales bacterium]